jgi:HKD family nuclease
MNNQEEYIQQLEQVINKFLEPLKGIPFSVAIKALTGFEVLAFELSDERNKKLLEQLKDFLDRNAKKERADGKERTEIKERIKKIGGLK